MNIDLAQIVVSHFTKVLGQDFSETKYVRRWTLPGGFEVNVERRGQRHVNVWVPWWCAEEPYPDYATFYPIGEARMSNLSARCERQYPALRMRVEAAHLQDATSTILARLRPRPGVMSRVICVDVDAERSAREYAPVSTSAA